jgi:hypothetical protein
MGVSCRLLLIHIVYIFLLGLTLSENSGLYLSFYSLDLLLFIFSIFVYLFGGVGCCAAEFWESSGFAFSKLVLLVN